ncbi:MAG TPA: TonB family protein [Acidobacteriaceae bacterium]|nr:TonB family protein [Acidobacteriaceae bacterium]
MPIRLTPTEPPVEQPEPEAPVLTEVLPPSNGISTASNGSGALPVLRYSRYQGLDHSDLLHVIEDLEGSRNWASLREKLWIALLIHLLLVWFLFYGSKHHFFNEVRVVNPVEQIQKQPKQVTFLAMPKDLQKVIRPKPTPVISDKNRIAETPHPTLDRKTLEQLQAMRRAGPPRLTAPPAPRPAPAQPPRQLAQQRPTPPAQPLPQNNQARLTAPPQAPVPNLRSGPSSPSQQLQNAMRQAMQGGQLGGDNGLNSPSQHQGASGAVDILSDTMGVDFGPYIERVIYDTERAWYPIIPEEARPPFDKQGQVFIEFKILPNGNVTDMKLVGPSGDVPLDRAAWAGITGASPFPPLPRAFKGPFLELRFDFLYNEGYPEGN